MQIEEHDKLVKLFDLYGNLLSEKQRLVLGKHLNLDLGESELAQELISSRQAVHDAVIKAKKQLLVFEEKCKFYQNLQQIKSKLAKISKNLSKNPDEASREIEKLIEEN